MSRIQVSTYMYGVVEYLSIVQMIIRKVSLYIVVEGQAGHSGNSVKKVVQRVTAWKKVKLKTSRSETFGPTPKKGSHTFSQRILRTQEGLIDASYCTLFLKRWLPFLRLARRERYDLLIQFDLWMMDDIWMK
jgi:hypothetical protein